MNNHNSYPCAITILIRKLQLVVKKLDEIKVKLEDLKEAKKELADLCRGFESEILHSGLVEDSSDDE